MPPTRPDEAELRKRLSPLEFDVTQKAGTERPFTGKFNKHKEKGVYSCVVCGEPLFASDSKFDSGTGWPSFFAPVEGGKVETKDDRLHGMVRTEARCASCAAHLGHVFDDGPEPTGERYCINSAALAFQPAAEDA